MQNRKHNDRVSKKNQLLYVPPEAISFWCHFTKLKVNFLPAFAQSSLNTSSSSPSSYKYFDATIYKHKKTTVTWLLGGDRYSESKVSCSRTQHNDLGQHFVAGTHLYSWVERGTVRVNCLAQEHNTMTLARAQTRTLPSVLTSRPVQLSCTKQVATKMSVRGMGHRE